MRKVTTIVLCMIISLSVLFTGCAGTNTDSQQDKKTGTEAGSGTGNLPEPGKYPLVKDKINLTFFCPQMASIENMETNLFTQEMEERTNVHVKWELVPMDGLKEKRSLILASGSYPDVFYGADITREEEMLYGPQGIFKPLNKLIDTYGINITKMFNTISYFKPAITTPDGNIYSIAQLNECYHCTISQKMWINKTWLDKLGLKMPSTTEEFHDVLKAFKTKDPNGNGKNDEVPLTGFINGWHGELPDFLMCAFIYSDGQGVSGGGSNNADRLYINDAGKVDCAANKAEWKEGLRYINSLFEEGLIDPAAFTQSREQLTQLGENPNAQVLGAASSGWFGYFAPLTGTRHKDYVSVPPLQGPKGVRTTAYYPEGIRRGQFSLSKTCKYPEVAVAWADYLYSPEGARRAGDGREGTEWVKPEAGSKSIAGGEAKFKRLVTFGNIQNICYYDLGPLANTSEMRLSEIAPADIYTPEGLEARLYKETKENYEPYIPKKVFPELYMEKDVIAELAQLKPAITDYIKENMIKFIVGDLDIDKDWDKYIDGFKGLKLDRYIQLNQDSYSKSSYSKQ